MSSYRDGNAIGIDVGVAVKRLGDAVVDVAFETARSMWTTVPPANAPD